MRACEFWIRKRKEKKRKKRETNHLFKGKRQKVKLTLYKIARLMAVKMPMLYPNLGEKIEGKNKF